MDVASAPKGRMMVPLCEKKNKAKAATAFPQFYQQKNYHLKRRKIRKRNSLATQFSILFYCPSILNSAFYNSSSSYTVSFPCSFPA